MSVGKIAFEDLQKVIRCIRHPPDVVVPPTPGFDAGVHTLGDGRYLVIATDPCIGVPDDWFGWLLVNYSASDVALFGARPRYCTVNLLGPHGTDVAIFTRVMEQACDAVEELDMTIVTGHTGTYARLSTLLATCTAYGMIEKNRLITPAGARPGDCVLLTKPLGLETLVNFTLTHPTLARDLFGSRQARTLARQVKRQSCVADAVALAEHGATAMHDATEGGIVAALNEMADASGVGFTVDYAALPIPPSLRRLATHFALSQTQLFSTSSTGTLLAALPPHRVDQAVDALTNLDLEPRIVGTFSRRPRRLLKRDTRENLFPSRIDDPYARIFSA
jgi:hydrogenase maturation factor